MELDNLTDEQKAKARECKTPEEMLALAREEGYELSDQELEAVSGGWGCSDYCTEKCYEALCGLVDCRGMGGS